MRAMASPMPLEAPVTRAARAAGMEVLSVGGRARQPTVTLPMRTPLVVMAVLVAALYGGWTLAAGGTREAAPPAPPAARVAPVAVIAARVEALRGLRFREVPRAVAVTPAQAEREGLEDLDRSYPPARRRADEEVLKLLGLIAPSVSLRDVSAETFSEGVAGYYDP